MKIKDKKYMGERQQKFQLGSSHFVRRQQKSRGSNTGALAQDLIRRHRRRGSFRHLRFQTELNYGKYFTGERFSNTEFECQCFVVKIFGCFIQNVNPPETQETPGQNEGKWLAA